MAYIDKVKEEIGWLKVIFAILIATDISLVAWLAQNHRKADPFLVIAGVIGAFCICNGYICNCLEELMEWAPIRCSVSRRKLH